MKPAIWHDDKPAKEAMDLAQMWTEKYNKTHVFTVDPSKLHPGKFCVTARPRTEKKEQ